MAKNKINNGLFDVSDLTENAQKNIEERGVEHTPEKNIHNTDTQPEYTMPQEETRSKRIQIVIKPSVNKELDRLVKQKKIKSKNDLVNFLLESFIEQNK